MATDQAPLVAFNETEIVTVGTISAGTSLDADGASDFGDAVVGFLKNNPGVKLLLNFQNITYLASAALSELLRINKAAGDTGSALQLCGLSKDIYKVFDVTQLSKVLKINPDEEIEKTIVRLNNEAEWQIFDG